MKKYNNKSEVFFYFCEMRICSSILNRFINSEILVGNLKMPSEIYEVKISESLKGLGDKVYKMVDKEIYLLRGKVSVSLSLETGSFDFFQDSKVLVLYEENKIVYGTLLKRSGNVLYVLGYSFLKEELDRYSYFTYSSFLGSDKFVFKNINSGLFSFTEILETYDLRTPGEILLKEGNKISAVGSMKMEFSKCERSLDRDLVKKVEVLAFFRDEVILGDLVRKSERNIVIEGRSFLAIDFFLLIRLREIPITDPSIKQVRTRRIK